MTTQDYKTYKNQALTGTLADDDNPIFIFSDTRIKLLADIISGKIDAKELAKMELKNRGVNEKGEWVGYNKGN